jgi:prevent-host-death family protein
MKKMAAGRFKTQCMRVLEEVRATGEPVIITKQGRPIAKLMPAGTFLGRLQGVVKIQGDIESPVEPIEAWEVLRGTTD